MRLLITGATGFIGRALALRALEAQHDVHTLTRRDWPGAPAVPRHNRHFGSFPFDIPERAFEGVDAVIHCAAVSHHDLNRSRAVNVVGTVRLARLAVASGVPNFVFLSSQSSRSDTPSAYGRTKFEAEQELRTVTGLHGVVLQPGLVCGPGGLFGRIARSARRLPLIPVIGANTPVQPIYVGDLVEAILACAARADELAGRVLHLGTTDVMRLEDFIAVTAKAAAGREVRLLPVPMRPLKTAVAAAEQMRLALPLNSANLVGVEAVRTMVTDADMRALDVPRRTPAEVIQLALSPLVDAASGPAGDGPARAALIGAGRIGVVHAVTLSRLPGVRLAAVVDKNPTARALLASIGVRTAYYASLEEALAQQQLDVAVIATPPASHMDIARTCLEWRLATLVEKPAVVREEQLPAWRSMTVASSRVLVGYLMPRIPHIADWIARLRAGELGEVRGFVGLTLVSLILARSPHRWETHKEVSGGGVLANSAGHVLSMIHRAFGPPASVAVETRKIVSADVEDAAVVQISYAGFRGIHLSSWSIDGFPRQENRLVVWTDRGTLTLTGSMGIFATHDGQLSLSHQLDADVGFNLAPDYAGGGVAAELNDLVGQSTSGMRGEPMTAADAADIESLLYGLYAEAREVGQFEQPALDAHSSLPQSGAAELRHTVPAASREGLEPRHVADLRDLDLQPAALQQMAAGNNWAEVLTFRGDLDTVGAYWDSPRIRLTVPNFMQQTRLIGDRRYAEVLRSFGVRGALEAGVAATLTMAREKGGRFWVAAQGLLAGDVAGIPKSFAGTILIHPYLVDLALALDLQHELEPMIGRIRARCHGARVGLHSNLTLLAANAVSTLGKSVDELSLLASPAQAGRAEISATLRTLMPALRLTAEVGPAPIVAHAAARTDSRAWSQGADAVVINGLVDPHLRAAAEVGMRMRWRRVFGEIVFPPAIW